MVVDGDASTIDVRRAPKEVPCYAKLTVGVRDAHMLLAAPRERRGVHFSARAMEGESDAPSKVGVFAPKASMGGRFLRCPWRREEVCSARMREECEWKD